jgi:hypothetical protein
MTLGTRDAQSHQQDPDQQLTFGGNSGIFSTGTKKPKLKIVPSPPGLGQNSGQGNQKFGSGDLKIGFSAEDRDLRVPRVRRTVGFDSQDNQNILPKDLDEFGIGIGEEEFELVEKNGLGEKIEEFGIRDENGKGFGGLGGRLGWLEKYFEGLGGGGEGEEGGLLGDAGEI